jgi:hypothetical protein
VIRWLCALVVGGILSGFAFLLLTGRYINDGEVLIRLTQGHGLHVGDLFVIAGWAVAMAALFLLARATAEVRSS